MTAYLSFLSQQFTLRSERFWFTPASESLLLAPRVWISTIAAIWFATWIAAAGFWFSPEGLLAEEVALSIAASDFSPWESRFLFSPLWYYSTPSAVIVYALVGFGLALASGIGLGGRWALAGLLLWIVMLAHRTPWLTGAVEPLLIASLAYLTLAPGTPCWARASNSLPSGQSTWQSGLALRLLQVHTWLLLLFGVLMQTAGLAWWRGEAVWWLTATGHSTLLSPSMLWDRELLVNFLTHGLLLTQLAALLLLWPTWLRPLGIAAGWLAAAGIALLADQFLYGMLLAGCLLSFRTPALSSR
jgi:hypothetical protein